jgi:hypothetical protein
MNIQKSRPAAKDVSAITLFQGEEGALAMTVFVFWLGISF